MKDEKKDKKERKQSYEDYCLQQEILETMCDCNIGF